MKKSEIKFTVGLINKFLNDERENNEDGESAVYLNILKVDCALLILHKGIFFTYSTDSKISLFVFESLAAG